MSFGDEEALLRKAGEFWDTFVAAAGGLVLGTGGGLDTIAKRRFVRFFDTADQRLRGNGYVFRERREIESGDREVTLKFRHPDRYLVEDRDMRAKKSARERSKTKFEEDIKKPFIKLYSFSTKQPVKAKKSLDTLDDPGRLYPDLPKRLGKAWDAAEPLVQVGGFTARELVIEGATLRIAKKPKVEAECALVLWYDARGDVHRPVVAEFCFRYGDDDERYDGKAARRAYEVFQGLVDTAVQKDGGPALEALGRWINLGSKTKTAYVYSLAEAASSA